jgi:hypothetical protein
MNGLRITTAAPASFALPSITPTRRVVAAARSGLLVDRLESLGFAHPSRGQYLRLPLARFATWGRVAGRGILSLIIISGVIVTIRYRLIVLLVTMLALESLYIGWEDIERPKFYLHLIIDLYSLLFIAFVVVLTLKQVFRFGPITSRRIQGYVAVYLLLRLLWAVSYEIVATLEPGSFSIGPQQGSGG